MGVSQGLQRERVVHHLGPPSCRPERAVVMEAWWPQQVRQAIICPTRSMSIASPGPGPSGIVRRVTLRT